MNRLDATTQQFVLELIDRVPDMTLATVRPDGYPQATTVSYANDGLTLYIGVGIDSQKAHNIRQNNKVSLTITPPYESWDTIRGLSMAGLANLVHDADESERAFACMLKRFPHLRSDPQAQAGQMPWPGSIFVRVLPTVISVLDYTKGFGHTDLLAVA